MTLFIVPTVTCNIYFSSKVAKHAKQHMLTKLSQWVSMRFCSLLHGFLSKSHDLICYIKLRRCSLLYLSIKTLDYVISPHHVYLSKTTKHWDSFVSHCKYGCEQWPRLPSQYHIWWRWATMVVFFHWEGMDWRWKGDKEQLEERTWEERTCLITVTPGWSPLITT